MNSLFFTAMMVMATVVAALLRKYHEPTLRASITRVLPQELPMIAIRPERLSGRASGGGCLHDVGPGDGNASKKIRIPDTRRGYLLRDGHDVGPYP